MKSYLQNKSKMSDLSRPHSLMLRNCLLDMIARAEEGNTNVELEERFVHEDNGEELPIPVFSSITPRSPIPFLLHVMLMCGKFETELDLRMHGSMRESWRLQSSLEMILKTQKSSRGTQTISLF